MMCQRCHEKLPIVKCLMCKLLLCLNCSDYHWCDTAKALEETK